MRSHPFHLLLAPALMGAVFSVQACCECDTFQDDWVEAPPPQCNVCPLGTDCNPQTHECIDISDFCTSNADCSPAHCSFATDGDRLVTRHAANGYCSRGQCQYPSDSLQTCNVGCDDATGCVISARGERCVESNDCEAGLVCTRSVCDIPRPACVPDHLDPTDDEAPVLVEAPHLELVESKHSLCAGDVDQVSIELQQDDTLFAHMGPVVPREHSANFDQIDYLEATLLDPDGVPIQVIESNARAQVKIVATTTGRYTLIMESTYDDIEAWRFAATRVAADGPVGCRDDLFEPNDDDATATWLYPLVTVLGKMPFQTLCEGDVDRYDVGWALVATAIRFDPVPAEGIHVRLWEGVDETNILWEGDLFAAETVSIPSVDLTFQMEVRPAAEVPVDGLAYGIRLNPPPPPDP